MIISYSAKNFFCFKEGIHVSFKFSKGCPDTVSDDKDISNVLCVKGANGAGKTNTLRVIAFLRSFCCDSFLLKPDEKLNLKSFFDNDDPSEFNVVFENDGIIYSYDLSLTKTEILYESLSKKEKRTIRLFEREKESFSAIKEFKELNNIKLRSNASIISTAHQYEMKDLDFAYNFFSSIIPSINAAPFVFSKKSFESINELYFEDKGLFNFTKSFLKKCDLGIKDIVIDKIQVDEDTEKYIPYFIHENCGKDYRIQFNLESSGTKSLYRQLFAYKLILDFGGLLVLDEFDINLHPDILPLLINLFRKKEFNKKNAQILFTTHNSEILNDLSKYRTILVNKDENESYLYRLDELPGDLIRNDRPLEPIYRSGKIRGVPRV